MSIPVPMPVSETKPFYLRPWFIITTVIIVFLVLGSCLNGGKSSTSSPSSSETATVGVAEAAKASASQPSSTVVPERAQKVATPKSLSDDKVTSLCEGHMLTIPDTDNTYVDWSVNWSRTDGADGAVTVTGQSYNRDLAGKRYPSFDVSCTVSADRTVTDFHFVEP